MTTESMYTDANNLALPNYEVFNIAQPQEHSVLKKPGLLLNFPLCTEDLMDIKILEAKFEQEQNCSGLAAPQIGISKRIIVFAAPENPQFKKWRPDFTQTMPKTIWINPSYEPIGTEQHEDYEACFSVAEMAGPVKRYKTIHYRAYDVAGQLITGSAEGFLARIIQHETDHVHGILFIDLVAEGKLLPINEYRRRRQEALASE